MLTETEYLMELFTRILTRPELQEEHAEGQTLAETLAGPIGLFSSFEPSDAAQNSEEEFGKIMDEKRRQGHI